ncbi:ribonuclease inhibitor-like [Oreochromis niloticus]|uniref:ribonuclease inhibitor-like n=1 Tax=Oreochromis niloticus TaxID=8128 RepID=UPI000DF22174|nr:ribonuclease inhibitor-like [Oreochromis niloticus]
MTLIITRSGEISDQGKSLGLSVKRQKSIDVVDLKAILKRLVDCGLSEISCDYLAAALKSNPSYPRVLDLSGHYNNLQDSGVKQLCVLLENPRCRFETLRLSHCDLSERSCEALSSGLSSQTSNLRQLDLSNINLKDSGVKLLSEGLKSLHCILETLRLSGCLITEEGCTSLASALSSNHSQLKDHSDSQ